MTRAAALPPAIRARVIGQAADALGGMSLEEVPATLRRVARFTPRKRAAAASGPLLAALDDERFRAAVSAELRRTHPEQVAALSDDVSEAPDPAAAAALLWLLRPQEWEERLATLVERLAERERVEAAGARTAEAERLGAELAAERAAHKAAVADLRDQLAAVKAERDQQSKAVRRASDRAQRSEGAAKAALDQASAQVSAAARRVGELEAELRRVRARLADAEAAVATGRAAARRDRDGDAVRLRVLLDSLLGAAQGLRRELALPPAEGSPADLVEAGRAPDAVTPSMQGRMLDDPASLERLLAVPGVHLIVDGYNVTKTAWGSLSLEQQRDRLVTGVAALVARTRIEATVVFDGAERDTAATTPAPRGVRVRFSDPGEIADELIARFVDAEPAGRPLVVVSSDGEVAAHAREAGAHAIASAALVRLLDRS